MSKKWWHKQVSDNKQIRYKQSKDRATHVTTTVQVTARPMEVKELVWWLVSWNYQWSFLRWQHEPDCLLRGEFQRLYWRPLHGHDIVIFDDNYMYMYVSNCQVSGGSMPLVVFVKRCEILNKPPLPEVTSQALTQLSLLKEGSSTIWECRVRAGENKVAGLSRNV